MLDRYARAWIGLHAKTDVSGWAPPAVLDAFCLLPLPAVSFKEWLSRRVAIASASPAPETVAETGPRPEVDPKEIDAHNRANVAGAMADAEAMPDFIKVEIKKRDGNE